MSTGVSTFKWVIKKASRTAIARGSFAIREALLPASNEGTPRVRALTYHRFGEVARDPFCVSPQQFGDQMRHIARAGTAISLSQLEAFMAGTEDLPQDGVLVTIDDGFKSTVEFAFPILRKLDVPAVAFVSAGLVGMKRGDPGIDAAAPEDYLDWKDLETLNAHNVSIQSHGCTHRSLGFLPPAQIIDELSRSKEMLEQRLGSPVTAFAYPFGTVTDYSAAIAKQAADLGYRLAFTSQHGAIRRGDDALTLARTKVEAGESLATFNSLVHGGLDAWRWVDRSLWRIQASRREPA